MMSPLNIIAEFIVFLKSGIPSLLLIETALKIDNHTLRVIIMKLLSWLRCEDKNKSVRPLVLNRNFSWCNALISLIETDAAFGALLSIEGNAVKLNSMVTEEEVKKITAMCAVAYNPPLMRK